MQHEREKTIHLQPRRRLSPSGWPAAVTLAVLGLFCFLAPAGALDYTGRIDTRYRFQMGDNAFGNDIYNYHSLELSLFKGFTFSWYGGVIASLNERVNTLSADGTEASDNALRGLQDAANTGQYINYRIYSAYLKYDAGIFGVMLGRCNPVDYQLTTFDGLLVWAAPFEWLKLEAFGGLPWHSTYATTLVNIPLDVSSGELAAGGGADLQFLDGALKLSVKYLFLREVTRVDGTISAAPATYLSADSLAKGRVSFSPWPWLEAGAAGSVLGLSPLSVQAWVSGDIEAIHLSYSAGGQMQLLDVSSVADRLTEFSSLLTASHPFFDVSGTLTENITGFFPPGEILSDVELELSYEHRQPLAETDLAMFNPQYDQFRVAALLGAKGGWSLQAFYALLLSTGLQNTLHVVGGEIGRKWSFLDIRLGSSFNASLYQTDYTQTVLQESFYAQEYYLRVKWQINRSFDVSLKGAYENALLASITSNPPVSGTKEG